MKSYRKQLGANIRQFREAKGWSQEKLSEKVELHSNSVAQIERGEIEPKVSTLVRLAKALGVTVADLVNGF